jgi:hypothetical protein
MTKAELKKEHDQICDAAGKLFGAMHRVSLADEDTEVLHFATATLATFRDFCDRLGYNFSVALRESKKLHDRQQAEATNSRN